MHYETDANHTAVDEQILDLPELLTIFNSKHASGVQSEVWQQPHTEPPPLPTKPRPPPPTLRHSSPAAPLVARARIVSGLTDSDDVLIETRHTLTSANQAGPHFRHPTHAAIATSHPERRVTSLRSTVTSSAATQTHWAPEADVSGPEFVRSDATMGRISQDSSLSVKPPIGPRDVSCAQSLSSPLLRAAATGNVALMVHDVTFQRATLHIMLLTSCIFLLYIFMYVYAVRNSA